ncbi:hypothetical protein EVAR_50528_1 [Eumeta japonica]|uniref:Secreted protein n=1 Tax=Eumeta variegata TaxID=151549 RepID=A0A4C1YRP0_EUMVA|nr:hypothetical protein EVAR_50528_1 [Eumeta japonica]
MTTPLDLLVLALAVACEDLQLRLTVLTSMRTYETVTPCDRKLNIMTQSGFVKAQSDNLPKPDVFMMTTYFANNSDYVHCTNRSRSYKTSACTDWLRRSRYRAERCVQAARAAMGAD